MVEFEGRQDFHQDQNTPAWTTVEVCARLKHEMTKKTGQVFSKIRFLFLAVALGVGGCAKSYAQESLGEPTSNNLRYGSVGELNVSDLLLEPIYLYEERSTSVGSFGQSKSGFKPGYSLLGVQWRRDRYLSGILKLGSKYLIGAPARYVPQSPTDDIGIIEGYGQIDSDLGRLRVGLVPIPFGYEGGDAEARLRFPRSLAFQYRLVNLRDYGVSYRITYDGFFSDWAIHNGEGGPDLDNEAWMTARWGWQGAQFVRIGVSGSAGRTSPQSTFPGGTPGTPQTLEAAGLDVTKISRVRLAHAFVWWDTRPIRMLVEATAGDVRQESREGKVKALHVDFEYETSPTWSLLTRYDSMDPRDDLQGDTITEASAGIAWRSTYENTIVTLIGTKRYSEDPSEGNHRVQLTWRISPSVLRLHSFL